MKIYRLLILLVVFILATFGITRHALATPDAPRVVINPATLACDPVFYWRDECGEAILPPGWEYSDNNACPTGYTETDLLVEWSKYQTNFCCQARGGEYCAAGEASPVPIQNPIVATPTPASPAKPSASATTSSPLAVVGGVSLLAGIGLGLYGLSRRKKSS